MKHLENIHKVLTALKHRKPTRIYCPRCASPKLNLSSSLDAWLTAKRYLCQNCGYLGPIVMEVEKEEETSALSQATPTQAASSTSYNDSAP